MAKPIVGAAAERGQPVAGHWRLAMVLVALLVMATNLIWAWNFYTDRAGQGQTGIGHL